MLLALAVVAVWGTNFVVIKIALATLPPLLALSLIIEGPAAIAQGIADADAAVWTAVLWQSVSSPQPRWL